jgi:hypothetical protein
MELHEIVMKLVGPVQPTGCHGTDEKHLANLRKLTDLIGFLLAEVNEASIAATRQEASMKAIGVHARDFLLEILPDVVRTADGECDSF